MPSLAKRANGSLLSAGFLRRLAPPDLAAGAFFVLLTGCERDADFGVAATGRLSSAYGASIQLHDGLNLEARALGQCSDLYGRAGRVRLLDELGHYLVDLGKFG